MWRVCELHRTDWTVCTPFERLQVPRQFHRWLSFCFPFRPIFVLSNFTVRSENAFGDIQQRNLTEFFDDIETESENLNENYLRKHGDEKWTWDSMTGSSWGITLYHKKCEWWLSRGSKIIFFAPDVEMIISNALRTICQQRIFSVQLVTTNTNWKAQEEVWEGRSPTALIKH